jgi:hypothetical protein
MVSSDRTADKQWVGKSGRKRTVYWNVTPCSAVEFNPCFGGTYWIILQVQKVARKKQEASLPSACWLLWESHIQHARSNLPRGIKGNQKKPDNNRFPGQELNRTLPNTKQERCSLCRLIRSYKEPQNYPVGGPCRKVILIFSADPRQY